MNSNEADPAKARDDPSKRAEDDGGQGGIAGRAAVEADEPSAGRSDDDETGAADDQAPIDLDLAHDRAS